MEQYQVRGVNISGYVIFVDKQVTSTTPTLYTWRLQHCNVVVTLHDRMAAQE